MPTLDPHEPGRRFGRLSLWCDIASLAAGVLLMWGTIGMIGHGPRWAVVVGLGGGTALNWLILAANLSRRAREAGEETARRWRERGNLPPSP